MDARKYLGQVMRLKAMIEQNKRILLNKEYPFIKPSMSGDADRVQSSPNLDGGYNKVVEIADAQRNIEKASGEYWRAIADIKRMIDKVENEEYAALLCEHWIECKRLRQIADEWYISYGRIRNIHSEAIRVMQSVLDKHYKNSDIGVTDMTE